MGVSASVANKYAMFIGKKYKYTGKVIITENNYICQYDNHTNIKLISYSDKNEYRYKFIYDGDIIFQIIDIEYFEGIDNSFYTVKIKILHNLPECIIQYNKYEKDTLVDDKGWIDTDKKITVSNKNIYKISESIISDSIILND